MPQKNTSPKNQSLLFCLVGMALILAFFFAVTPNWKNTQIIAANLSTTENAETTIVQRDFDEKAKGLFWEKFTTESQLLHINHYILRTAGCLNSLSINGREWNLPQVPEARCDNREGLAIAQVGATAGQESQWSFAGDSNGGAYGFFLDKDWHDPLLVVTLAIFIALMIYALYLKLPLADHRLRFTASAVLGAVFLLRFIAVFLKMPPEMSLFSDMGAYFNRATELSQGVHNLNQLFQPVGFTLWSWAVRTLGDWELFKWTQVFFSWGTVLVIFLIALDLGGAAVALVAVIFAAVHVPHIGFAGLHMAENIYTFLLTLSLWWILRILRAEKNKTVWSFFTFGVLLTIAFYFKGNHSFFIPLFAAWYLYRERQQFKKAFTRLMMMALGCLLIVVPYAVWTSQVYGKAQMGPSAGGLNFVEGKCPWKNNRDSQGITWMSPLFAVTGENGQKDWDRPFTDQSYFWGQGFKCIQENPKVLLTSFRYIYYLFLGNDTWPVAGSEIQSWYAPWSGFFAVVLLPLSLLGLLTLPKRSATQEVFVLMFLSVFITVYVFKSETRFRVPFDGILLIWSSFGAVWLAQKFYQLLFLKFKKSEHSSSVQVGPTL